MKEIEYIHEEDFSTEKIYFSDEYYDLAVNIREKFKDEDISPLMVGKDKKSLLFCINFGKDIISNEIGDNTYRIRIEKL